MSTLERAADHEAMAPQPSAPPDPADPVLVERTIRPSRGWIGIDWKELYQSRELFDTLISRDVKIRYKQTVFGVAWAIVQPLVNMVLFTLIFRRISGVDASAVPYPLFLLAGTVPWTFFSNAVSASGTSLFGQQGLITKIYFPRLYIPASTVGGYLIDMAIGFALFAFLFPIFHYSPSANLVFLPFLVLLTFCAAFGLGLIMASMTLLFRDLRFVIPFFMQMMMFASPLFYDPKHVMSDKIRLLVSLNPISGIITTYRWCILGLPLDVPALVLSVVITALLLVLGLFAFRKTEKYFADLL